MIIDTTPTTYHSITLVHGVVYHHEPAGPDGGSLDLFAARAFIVGVAPDVSSGLVASKISVLPSGTVEIELRKKAGDLVYKIKIPPAMVAATIEKAP